MRARSGSPCVAISCDFAAAVSIGVAATGSVVVVGGGVGFGVAAGDGAVSRPPHAARSANVMMLIRDTHRSYHANVGDMSR
jgi:hypothetical protein